MRRHFQIILLLIGSLGLTHCGFQKSESSKITFQVTPTAPVVIDQDFTWIDYGDPGTADDDTMYTAKAPWYRYGYYVRNDSDKILTIQNLKTTVTGFTIEGNLVSSTSSIDLTSLDGIDTDADGNPDITPSYLEQVPAGGGEGGTSGTAAGPISYVSGASFITDGMPEGVPGFIYSVQVDIQGWFGPFNEPDSRVEKSFWFSTQ